MYEIDIDINNSNIQYRFQLNFESFTSQVNKSDNENSTSRQKSIGCQEMNPLMNLTDVYYVLFEY